MSMKLRLRYPITVILMIAIITAIFVAMVTANIGLSQSYITPFKVITTKLALIEYFSDSGTGHPVLLIHAYMNGQPIKVHSPLPRGIYTRLVTTRA
ncbi:hypothetical protein [Vulcanisaeta distributa]|uniref:Uncharacterized protein n=1 Tax=Vulcanisaeta distributa (strain DSM 14429 / JCM 11212 / NBRC 100878 / IC-017) TaxID=572478 RepID=E1QRE1_VULDI|nr:hypothetical protein [Vulcanisaeta distributa]ADN50638.1 hypothetical protein Vdis_1252 [Vulcanisaeta distributa DSM 14429]